MDFVDTALKGMDHFLSLGLEYPLRNLFLVVVCSAAIYARQQKSQSVLLVLAIVCQMTFIMTQFGTI